jgi:hypothetical protein
MIDGACLGRTAPKLVTAANAHLSVNPPGVVLMSVDSGQLISRGIGFRCLHRITDLLPVAGRVRKGGGELWWTR